MPEKILKNMLVASLNMLSAYLIFTYLVKEGLVSMYITPLLFIITISYYSNFERIIIISSSKYVVKLSILAIHLI